jgi:hypothetical protein
MGIISAPFWFKGGVGSLALRLEMGGDWPLAHSFDQLKEKKVVSIQAL